MLAAVLGALLAAQAPLWSESQAHSAPLIGEISFEGAEPESVRALVEVQVGAPLDARDVRDSVRALHASARFSRVAAYVESMGDGRVRTPDLGGNSTTTEMTEAILAALSES